jgi:hypothetical protein
MSKLTAQDLLTSSNKYPERAKHKECTDEVKKNAQETTDAINGLLDELGIDKREYTSGFRPSDVNASIANAAKKSCHQRGLAGDLLDDMQQTLSHQIMARPDLLKKYKLWLEHPDNTRGKNSNWTHLDRSTDRSDRAIRVFRA